jgi:predicted ribosomally synthesized peptide with SipW-like signal peptide
MAFSRNFLTAGALGVGALALIGAGASATFTDEVSAAQSVNAGKMSLRVTSVGGTTSEDGRSVILPAFGPVGSTFETPANVITVTNTSDIPVASVAFQMSATNNGSNASAYLNAQTNVCIRSTDPSGTWVEGNGPLTTAVALTPTVKQNPVTLAPNASMNYSVNFYAGKNSTTLFDGKVCGATISDGPGTTAAWKAISGAYVTPASLTNAAQGGLVTPKLTFSFTG